MRRSEIYFRHGPARQFKRRKSLKKKSMFFRRRLLVLILGMTTLTVSCSMFEEEDNKDEETLLVLWALANSLQYRDSCNYSGSNYCQDSYGFGGGAQNCTTGTYQTTPCSTSNVIGSCRIVNSNGLTSSGFILLFYTGFATPQSTCSGFGGTYSASIQAM